MTLLQAIILGLIQGVTEFLPISSSGHLVLAQHLFGLKEPELFFDISVHFGTLMAVIIFFRKDLIEIIIEFIKALSGLMTGNVNFTESMKNSQVRLGVMIIVGSVPTAILGLLFHKIAEELFSSVLIVGIALMVTGTILALTRKVKPRGRPVNEFSFRDALIIGTVQGIAIIPGISRSGSTISAGLFSGLDKEVSSRYSFLLCIPAIVGAQILSLKDMISHSVAIDLQTVCGTSAAAGVGYAALALLMYMVKRGQLYIFAPYCGIVGLISIIISL